MFIFSDSLCCMNFDFQYCAKFSQTFLGNNAHQLQGFDVSGACFFFQNTCSLIKFVWLRLTFNPVAVTPIRFTALRTDCLDTHQFHVFAIICTNPYQLMLISVVNSSCSAFCSLDAICSSLGLVVVSFLKGTS